MPPTKSDWREENPMKLLKGMNKKKIKKKQTKEKKSELEEATNERTDQLRLCTKIFIQTWKHPLFSNNIKHASYFPKQKKQKLPLKYHVFVIYIFQIPLSSLVWIYITYFIPKTYRFSTHTDVFFFSSFLCSSSGVVYTVKLFIMLQWNAVNLYSLVI